MWVWFCFQQCPMVLWVFVAAFTVRVGDVGGTYPLGGGILREFGD